LQRKGLWATHDSTRPGAAGVDAAAEWFSQMVRQEAEERLNRQPSAGLAAVPRPAP